MSLHDELGHAWRWRWFIYEFSWLNNIAELDKAGYICDREVGFSSFDSGQEGEHNGSSFVKILNVFMTPGDISSKQYHLTEFSKLYMVKQPAWWISWARQADIALPTSRNSSCWSQTSQSRYSVESDVITEKSNHQEIIVTRFDTYFLPAQCLTVMNGDMVEFTWVHLNLQDMTTGGAGPSAET